MRRAGPTVILLAAAALAVPLLSCADAAPPPIRVAAPLGPGGGELRVLLPPPSAGAGPFPVVYFLHDLWGSDAILWKQGVAQRLLREEKREVPPFVLVAPEGDRGFWADSWDGRRRYEQWVSEELPAQVAARWPVRRGPGSRAYVGISMGGLGAVRMGLRHPQETAAIVSISGLLVPLDRQFVRDANPLLRHLLTRVFGRSGDEALRHNDPYRVLGTLADVHSWPERQMPALPPVLLLAGEQDKYRLDDATRIFDELAQTKGIATELRIEHGGHDWKYWREAAAIGILWAARQLQEAPRS